MKPSTKRFASALAALLFFVGAFIVFFELVQPAYGDLMVIKGKLVAEQMLLQNESTIVTQVTKVIKAYGTQGDARTAISTALPIGQDIAGATAQIYGLADANHITVQNTGISVSVPQSAVVKSAAAASSSRVSFTLRPTGTIAFTLSAVGRYEDFLNFVSGFETNMRVFDVKQVSILPVSSGNQKGQASTLFTYHMTVNTYFQIP